MANCIRPDGDCSKCESFNEEWQYCMQDEDEGGTGHGDLSLSDADPEL